MANPKTDQPEQTPEQTPTQPPATRTTTLHRITAIQHDILHPITGQLFKLHDPVELEDIDSVLHAQIRAGLMRLG